MAGWLLRGDLLNRGLLLGGRSVGGLVDVVIDAGEALLELDDSLAQVLAHFRKPTAEDDQRDARDHDQHERVFEV